MIIRTGPYDYYLLVLWARMPDLNFTGTIILSSTGKRIEAKLDCVEVVGPACSPETIPTLINPTYKLNGHEDVEFVKGYIVVIAPKL